MLDALLERLRGGDRLALSRLLTLLARGEYVGEVRARLSSPAPRSRVVAVTGSGGVGKSSLIGRLIEVVRRRGQSVAVLACDPQSPVSGGALLGDRFRMSARPDDGVFIRSLAAPGGHGAVAAHLDAMIDALEEFGFDVILLETVGAGQGDVRVRELADVLVLLLQPETGDDLQWEKAGVLEVADVVFIQKADLPGAEQVEAQVRTTVALSGAPPVPVLRGSARTGQGIEELWTTIAGLPARRQSEAAVGQELLRAAQELLAARLAAAEAANRPPLRELVGQWRTGGVSRADAAAILIRLLDGADSPL